jgi:hypothetical protein
MGDKIAKDFEQLHTRLRLLEAEYNPHAVNLHFDGPLVRADRKLYDDLLQLTRDGLDRVRQHRASVLRKSLYSDGMFSYDLCLLISAAAMRTHGDKTQDTIAEDVVKALTESLVELSEYSAGGGDMHQRNFEALRNTLWAFYSGDLLEVARLKSRAVQSRKVARFVKDVISSVDEAQQANSSEATTMSGMISLESLYAILMKDRSHEGLLRKKQQRAEYGRKAEELCGGIADCPGFYLWGRYEPNGLWRNIYLGKAGRGKTTSLRARILKELKDERSALWISKPKVTIGTLDAAGEVNHGKMWPKYRNLLNRILRKAGATHIVWAADPAQDDSKVRDVESDLIELLSPSGNLNRPVPPHKLQDHTKEIVAEFRRLIHTNRKKRCVPLVVPEIDWSKYRGRA